MHPSKHLVVVSEAAGDQELHKYQMQQYNPKHCCQHTHYHIHQSGRHQLSHCIQPKIHEIFLVHTNYVNGVIQLYNVVRHQHRRINEVESHTVEEVAVEVAHTLRQ
jgi:hypothetical protein